MEVILPRRKKRVDIFAHRKSVEAAKGILGYAYFDQTRTECSTNAIELSKFVQKLENIDKEKARRLRDLTREQHVLIRSLKRFRSRRTLKESSSNDATSSALGGKPIPSEFRFKNNGETNTSMTYMPHCNVTDSDKDLSLKLAKSNCFARELSIASHSSNVHRIRLEEDRIPYTSRDIDQEIKALRCDIVDICKELSNSKISIPESNTATFKQFLRAHSNEYVVEGLYGSTDDRFAFQFEPTERQNVGEQTIKKPSARSCTACQFKLKQKSDDLQKTTLYPDNDILKQQWCYFPTDPRVLPSTGTPSSTAAVSNTSLFFTHSVEHIDDTDTMDSQKQSTFHLKLNSEIQPTTSPLKYRHSARVQSHLNRRTQSSRDVRQVVSARGRESEQTSAHSIIPTYRRQGTPTESESRINAGDILDSSFGIGSETSLSSAADCNVRSLTSARSCWSRHSLLDFDSRINMMKQFQVSLS